MNREFRWAPRKWAARVTRALVFVVPLAAGVVAATLVARALPPYGSLVGGAGWWAVVLASSFLAVNLIDRVARRFLPLAALLDLSLVFPGEAPSRVKVAMRTWTTAQLRARIHEARDQGIDDDPTRAGESVLVLVAALNAHDRVTRGHAERTRAYADVLAEELGVPVAEREKLRWAALLHDVGKLKIAEEVLNKAGKLEHQEWEIIKLHPQFGDELITPIKGFLGSWADTVLHHHERYDGAGYPQRLVGEDIAYGARIVAVADAFDAMTARRSYQPGMPPRKALRELSDNAGVQFDPVVVRAFLNLSARRIRRIMGPLTALAQVPFVAGFQRVVEWTGTLASGTVAVAAAVAMGVVAPIAVPAPPVPLDAAIATTVPPTTSTTLVAALPHETTLPPRNTTPTTTTTVPATTTAAPAPTTTVAPVTTTAVVSATTTTAAPATTTTAAPVATTTTAVSQNSAPIAANDSVAGNPISVFQIKVLDNDSDPDGDLLSIIAYDTASALGGIVSCDVKCRYEGPDGWSAEDSFTYTIGDGNGGTDTATVRVTPNS